LLAGGTILLAVVALFTLLISHLDTKRAIKKAETAADRQHTDTLAALGKAEVANDIAKKSLFVVQRPFVSVAQTPMAGTLHGTDVRWSFPIYWENSGATATKNLYIEVYCPDSDHELADPTTQKGNDVFQIRTVFGPKQTTLAGGCSFNPMHMAAIQAGTSFTYIVAKSIYQDRFDEHSIYVTENCERVVATSADWNNPTLNNTTFMPGFCRIHNCADDECPQKDIDDARKTITKNEANRFSK
jgi:hypothetical protein